MELEWDDEELQRRLGSSVEPGELVQLLFQNMHKAFRAAAESHDSALRRRHRALPPKGRRKAAGSPLARISGNLIGSLDYEITPGFSSDPRRGLRRLQMLRFARGGPGAPAGDRPGEKRTSSYARLHEKGGTVRPVRARILAVPLPNRPGQVGLFTAAGDQRYSSPRQVKGAWVSRPGKLPIFVGEPLPGREPEPLWIGRKSVTIPPRLGFVETWQRQASSRQAVLERAVEAAAEGRSL